MDKAGSIIAVVIAAVCWFIVFGASTGLYNTFRMIKNAIQWSIKTLRRI